jgi:hypothetical protein
MWWKKPDVAAREKSPGSGSISRGFSNHPRISHELTSYAHAGWLPTD